MTEDEEFEFRLRLEREQGKPGGTSVDMSGMIEKKADRSVGDRLALGAMDIYNAVTQGKKNLGGGLIRGAGSIGATGVRVLPNAIGGDTATENQQRRKDMDAALSGLGADTDSMGYGGGKLIAEIAGTAGAGGGLAGLLSKIPGLATKAAPVIAAIQSGGMSTGGVTGAAGVGARVVGGGITGGASAAAVNPEDFGMGAAIGAAAGPVVQGAVKLGKGTAGVVRNAMLPQEARLAQRLADTVGLPKDQLLSLLNKQGPQLIDGYQATVPQILQNPAISQLQRTLKTAGNDALGSAERTQQQQFMQTLNRVAPVDLTVQDAAARAGNAIQDFAVPAEKAASQEVSRLFEAIPSDQAVMQLPLNKMNAARDKYMGPGTFGKGGAPVDAAIDEARVIGTRAEPGPALDYSSSDLSRKAAGGHAHGAPRPTIDKPVPFDQLQKLRSSIGEAITAAEKNGNNQAKASLIAMKNAIDNKVAEVAGGTRSPGEIFTPQAIDTWGQALAAHGVKKQQFATGPQAQIFRQGGDGQPALQGAEIPGKFYSGRRSQVEDMQAFNRLVGTDPQADMLTRELQRYATTEGANTATAAGNLSSKYGDWLASRSGANRELFDPGQNAALKAINDAVESGISAENLGRVTGSDTAQKLASLQSIGLLDNGAVNVLANRIPIVGNFTGPMLEGLRSTARGKQSDTLAGLLANPDSLSGALNKIKPSGGPQGELAKALLQYSGRSAPVIYAD